MITEQQLAIVNTENSKNIVLASAGSGKTFVVTSKIEHLIKTGVDPARIMMYSFSRVATQEMREKLKRNLTSSQYQALNISTFHSFCYHLILKYKKYTSVRKEMNIVNSDQLKGMLKKSISYICQQNGLDSEDYDADSLFTHYTFRRWKQTDPDPASYNAKKIIDNCIEYLNREDIYTFDDLIIMSCDILTKYPDVKKEVQNSFDVMILDESQDTQVKVTDLLKLLINEKHNLSIFGDVNQTLYRWNFADPFKLLEFMHSWNSKIFYLNETFRFGNTISSLANKIVEDIEVESIYKIPTVTNQTSEATKYVLGNNDLLKMEYVVSQIKALYESGVPYNQINILSRVNSQLGLYAKLLMESGIPAVLKGGNILQRKEVKFLLSVLSTFKKVSTFDLTNIFENYNVGIDSVTISKVLEGFKGDTIYNLIDYVNTTKIKDVGEERKKGFLTVCKKIISCFECVDNNSDTMFMDMYNIMDMESFKFMKKLDDIGAGNDERLKMINLLDDIRSSQFSGDKFSFPNYLKVTFTSDSDSEPPNAVMLRTIHASKGMSLPYVFLDLTKFCSFPDYEMLDEMFCLYVGVTRAKHKLWFIANSKNPFNVYMSEDTLVLGDEEDIKKSFIEAKSEEHKTESVSIKEHCKGTRSNCSFAIQVPNRATRITDKAIMLSFGSANVWIPKSCIHHVDGKYFASPWWIKQGNAKYLLKG